MSIHAENHRYAVILAGGSGRRFWPVSRDARPKQLLKLLGEETLLEASVRRLEGVVPPQNILILTNADQADEVRRLLPQFGPDNIVAEPAKRDTAPAIALAMGWVARRNPMATMLVLPADHLIQNTAAFQNCLRDAIAAAEQSSALVTIGIKPDWPCPSYGYIERGKRATITGWSGASCVYEVEKFREKPAPELAEQFLAAGNFTWNAGMFIWTLPTAVSELSHHCPELMSFVQEMIHAKDFLATMRAQFPALRPISIDYALMEKAGRVLNVEASFDWDDLGSWISLAKYLPQDHGENACNSPLAQMDAQGNIVFAEGQPQVALLGVRDLIIVKTGDALLIADKHSADAIKKLVDLVPKELH